MHVALLFNSNHPKYGYSYGDPIRSTVFGPGILQASGRHMKVSIGDVLIFGKSKSWDEYDDITNRTYFAGRWSLLHERRLRATFRKATVYALTFENMTKAIAEQLHRALTKDDAYLGLMEIDLAYGPHLGLFRNSMVTSYRILGTTCHVFYSMDYERDDHELNAMRQLGFVDVQWEDKGARGTIFDDFDTPEHFEQVAAFRNVISSFIAGGMDAASELVMVLEDLNAQLFQALGAAVAALARAKNTEDIAQASLSGRRYLEKLADALFPPRQEDYKGRKAGREQYRNRIWAYIADNTPSNSDLMQALGKEADRLVGEFNSGLHSEQQKERVLQALADCAAFTGAVLALNPPASRKPYLAHEKRILEFMREVIFDKDRH